MKRRCIPEYFHVDDSPRRGINPCNQPRIYPERRRFLALLLLLLSCLPLKALVLAWDSSAGATGYRLYYGQSSSNYTQVVDCTTTSNSIALPAGTYYFAVSAYNATTEGAKSSEIQVTVQQPILVKLTLEYSTNSAAGPYWPGPTFFVTNSAIGPQKFYRAVLLIQ